MNLSKRFLIIAVFLIPGAFDCAALGLRQNQEIDIQAIIEQWAYIERDFIEEQFFDSKNIEGG
jgi:hypothetical protein